MNMGLRTRFIGILALATLVAAAISAIAARVTVGHDLSSLATQQVQSGSTGFAGYWDAKRSSVKLLVQQVALDTSVRRALASHDGRALAAQLTDVARQGGLAFLTVVDTHGRIIAGANATRAGVVHPSPFLTRALSGETVSTAATIPASEVAGEQLTAQVDTTLTGGGTPEHVTTGLGLIAATPVSDANERTVGAVYGGVLLNHYYDVVDQTTHSLGGKAAIIAGDAIVSSSISRSDGTRLVDAVSALGKQPMTDAYQGVDTEAGTPYMVRVEPVKDDQGTIVALRWYGVPMAVFDQIANHTTMSILLWGAVGILIALALAIPVVESVARALIRRSKQVRASAKELSVVIVGSEIGADHIKQTRETVERQGERLMSLATETGAVAEGGLATRTGVSAAVMELSALNAEILSDVVVIDTLAEELAGRTQQAVQRVGELNEVAAGLDALVTGSKS